MSFLEGLRFRPGESVIHKLDPRVKLLTSFLILVSALVYVDSLVITMILAAEAVMMKIAEVERLWLKTVKGSIPFAVLVFVITFLTDYSITGLTFNTVYKAFTYSYRIILFLSSFSLFFLTTTPDEIALTMTKMRIPYQYTFAFVSAVRFTPVLAQEIRNIMDAQKSRGLELDKGSLIRRVRRLIPILVPLLVNVLRRSYEMAEAMEVKCFGVAKKRTYLRELQFKRIDYVFLACVLLLFSVEMLSWSLGLRPDYLLLRYLGVVEFSKLS